MTPARGKGRFLPTFNQELTALRPRPFRITARAKPNAPTNSRVLVLASGTAAAGVTVKIPRPASLLSQSLLLSSISLSSRSRFSVWRWEEHPLR